VVFVIRPVRVPLPRVMSRLLCRLLVWLRLVDPAPGVEPNLGIALDLRTVPLAGVILLLITTAIPGKVLREGIVGADAVVPYNVLVLFISLVSWAWPASGNRSARGCRLVVPVLIRFGPPLPSPPSQAYISTSLDSTGGLRSLAFWIAKKSAHGPSVANDAESEVTVGRTAAGQTADGRKLWAILYWFWFVAGVIFGNDPIVLSGELGPVSQR